MKAVEELNQIKYISAMEKLLIFILTDDGTY
jgi:hypothetical protein